MMKSVMPAQSNKTHIELRCAFDPEKMHAYSSFLSETAKGKVVCDLGTGCGVLAYLALYHGAEKVICVDVNTDALARCKELLSDKNAEFLELNLLDEDLPEADIYIHEIYGNLLYDEKISAIYQRLQQQGIADKCYPHKGRIFSYNCDQLSFEKYRYNADDFDEATREYHSLLTDEELRIGAESIMDARCYNYKEKNLLETFDLSVDQHTMRIYNIVALVEKWGWDVTFPNGAKFTNIPRKGNNWYLPEQTALEQNMTRITRAHYPSQITPKEV